MNSTTVRIPDETADQLDRLAEKLSRPADTIAAGAIEDPLHQRSTRPRQPVQCDGTGAGTCWPRFVEHVAGAGNDKPKAVVFTAATKDRSENLIS